MKTRFLTILALVLAMLFIAPAIHAQPKRELMHDAHALVFDHTTMSRTVEKLPNGVRTTTTTSNPEMLPILRKHPRQMGDLYKRGGMVRGWDPVFRELAAVGDKVKMEAKDIPNGIEVMSTSDDPEVVKLIQAHADKVSDMVRRGTPAMQEATPIPPGYERPGMQDTTAKDDSATTAEAWDGTLIQFGTMRDAIGKQQSQGRVTLDALLKRPHLYGLGALEGLTGELTILNGTPTLTQVNPEGVPAPIETAMPETKATLFVGAYVPQWTEHTLASPLSPDTLEQYLAEAAAKSGLDAANPFVFAIDGNFQDARVHIIHGACPMHARLNKIELPEDKKPFEADYPNTTGTVFGVFARDAVGEITHPGTHVHMHLQFVEPTSGKTVTGHLERIGVSTGAIVYLPKVK